MTAFQFSDEARIYADNFNVVELVRKKWQDEIDNFHVELFGQLKKVVIDLDSVPPTKKTPFPEWRRAKWSTERTYIALWRDRYYPALVRDRRIEFFVSCWLIEKDKADEAGNSVLLAGVSAALRDVSGIEYKAGDPRRGRALKLEVAWKSDPLGEATRTLGATLPALDLVVRDALAAASPKRGASR